MKKRVLSTILALAMVLSMFAVVTFADDTTTTVTYDTSAAYGWSNYLNVVNVIPDKSGDTEGLYADLRAEGTPYKIFLNELLAIMQGAGPGTSADGSYMNSYMMTQDGYTDQKLYDYVQDTYGAVIYMLRGGKQMGYDAWNNVMPDELDLVYNDAGYTYVNEDVQTAYTQDSYHAALAALNAFLVGANDNNAFNVDTTAARPFVYEVQKGKFEALQSALAKLEPAAPALIDLTGVTSENTRLQMWIDTYNNIDVEEYKAKEEVQTWGAVLKAAAEDPSIEAGTAAEVVDAYEVDGNAVCGYWESTVRNVVPQSNGLRVMADEVWNDPTNWPLGEVVSGPDQAEYVAEQYTAAYNKWVEIRDTMRNQFATLKVSAAIAEVEGLKTMIQSLEKAENDYTTEDLNAYNNLKAYISIYDGRVARIVLEASKQLENYITLKNGVDRAHEIIDAWEAGTAYAKADEMYGLISKDVSDSCTLEDSWMALRAQVGLDNGLPTFVEAYIAQWTESGLYTEESLAKVQETYLQTRDTMKQNSSLTDEGALQYIDTLKALLVEGPVDLTDVTSANTRLQMWIDTYNNIDVAEYKTKEEVQIWGKVLKAAAEDPSTATSGDAVDTYAVDGVEICAYWETSVRKVVPQSEGLKAMADAVWNDTANWPLGEVITDLNQTTYEAEGYTAAYNQWANIRDTLRNQFATLKVSEALAELDALKSMIQGLKEVDLPYDAEQLAAYNHLKANIAIYDGRVARIVLDENKQLENYITLKNGVDRVHEIITNWDAGTEYATADEMYGLIDKEFTNCILENAWMALRAEVGLDAALPAFVEAYIAEWTESGLYTEESLAAVQELYMQTRDTMKQNSSLTDEGVLQYIDTLKGNLAEKAPELIDLTGVTSDNARLQFWIDIYNNIDVAEYKELSEVQAWGAVILAAYEGGTITSSTSGDDVDAYTQGDIAICGYWEGTIRNIVPQNNGLRVMADEIWNNGENWPLGENITDLNQTTYEPEAYKAAYDQWVYIRDTLRNQQATVKVSEALAELDKLKSMIQGLEEVDLPYDAEQLAAYNNLKAYISIYDGRIVRIVLEENKQLENYITLKEGIDRVHEIITNWDAGTEYATADEMYGLIDKDVTNCILENAWMALRAQVGLDAALPAFVEAYIAEWTESGLYTEESLAAVNETYLSTRDTMKQNSSLTDEGVLQYIDTLKGNLAEKAPELIDLTGVTSENARLQMWIDTYNNIDVEEYKAKEEVQVWGAVLKAAAEDPSIEAGTAGEDVDAYEVDGNAICGYWETSVRKVVPQSEGLKAMADVVWNDTANWPLGEVITDLNQTTYEAEGYTAAYNQWANIRDTLRNQFATLKVSEALAELDELKSMIQGLEEVDLPYDAEQLAAYNNLKAYISIYDGRIARIVLDENKQLENYITLKEGIDRVHEIIANWDAGTEYATADEMYGLISKDVSESCTLEDAWMALRAEVGLDAALPAFVEAYIAEWTESGLYTEASLAAVQELYMKTRDTMKQDSSLTDEGVLTYIDTLKGNLVEIEKPAVPGDANGDGETTLCDVLLVARMLVDGSEFTADQLKVCDVTGDGIVSLTDVIKIARMVAEA